jgi:hypothetical protein
MCYIFVVCYVLYICRILCVIYLPYTMCYIFAVYYVLYISQRLLLKCLFSCKYLVISSLYLLTQLSTFLVLFWSKLCANQLWFRFRVKVKQFRNRLGVAQRIPGGLGSQISWHSAREGGKVVSRTHRPPYPQECSWYSFLLGAESTPGPWYGRKEICHWKIQWHHRESIPGPSD